MKLNNKIGKNVVIKEGAILGENVTIGDNVYIDHYTIIRDNVSIGSNSTIGANSIIGEFQVDFYDKHENGKHPLVIGDNAIIRSGSIIYGDSIIGNDFQTGHNVTIREHSNIGNHVSVGTLSDIQGYCEIGNYVRMHSNVHIGHKSKIEDFVWIFPYVVLTNDPTPPSYQLDGVTVRSFAVIATRCVVLPGVEIKGDSLVAAGAVVTKDVDQYSVVGGNPGKVISDVRKIKNRFTGEEVYPWRYTFKRGMPWENTDYDSWYKGLEDSIQEENDQ